jgi:hypothetical protein
MDDKLQLLEARLKETVDEEASRSTLDSDYEAGLSDGAMKLAQKLLEDFFAAS